MQLISIISNVRGPDPPTLQTDGQIHRQAGRQLVRSLLTLRVFVVDVMDLRTGDRNEDDS